jgi:hypothetical protein
MMVKKKDEPTNEEETKNLPIDVEASIKKQLDEQRGQLGALPTNKIGLNNKEFALPDGQKSAGPLECIILDFAWALVHYPGVYNSNNPQQPNCFATGRQNPESKSDPLVPHETVASPQGKNCRDCAKNQWKSAATGRGKACKNQRRLIVVPPDFDEETEVMTMYVSPKGLKNFDKYVARLSNEHGVLPTQVVTAIAFNKDETYPLLQFKFVERHTRVNDAWAMRERSQDLLFRELETKADKAA